MKKGIKDEYLQITITPMKVPKNKILRWLFWNIYWKVWNIWKPKFLAWFYGGIANFLKKRLPDEDKNV